MTTTTAMPGSVDTSIRYEPALDGLRAVAVLAVMAYHAGYGWMRGGFLGVDAFFVLSGYLITALLLSEHRRRRSIALVAFWGRRARRLLPALLLVLLAVVAYSSSNVPAIELGRLRGDALSSLFYFTNWRFIASGASYFNLASGPSPLRHLWSLAIEEQFYVVWPLVVLGCLRAGRHGRRLLFAVTVMGLAGSALLMATVSGSGDASRSYYGTDARAHTILVGAALALLLARPSPRTRRSRRSVHTAGLAGALTTGWMLHAVSGRSAGYYRGGSLVFAVAVAAVIAAAVQPGRSLLRYGLSLPPLVWIGRISYGLYLWHWPVDVFATATRVGIGGAPLELVHVALTFALATASFYLVEQPIRRSRTRPHVLRALAPVSIALTGIVIVAETAAAAPLPSYLGGGAHAFASRAVAAAAPPPVAADRPARKLGMGARTNIEIFPCPPPSDHETSAAWDAVHSTGGSPAPAPDGPVRVLVVGDSVACSVAVGLAPAGAPAISVRQIAIIGCGVVSDEIWDRAELFPKSTEKCHEYVAERERAALAEFHPQVVLWVSTWERFNLVDRGRLLETGTAPWRRALQHRFDAALDVLTSGGAHVLVTTIAAPAPAGLLLGGRVTSPEFDWRFGVLDEQLAAFVARHPSQTTLLDVAALLCPNGPPCPSRVGSVEPRGEDGAHFDPSGSVWLARWLLPRILAAARDAPARASHRSP